MPATSKPASSELKTCELMLKCVSDAQFPYGQCVSKNLEVIREESLPKWLEMQKKRWSCKNCGMSHSSCHETCTEYGHAVASYKADLRSAY